jgi:hypothetical protein
MKSLICTLAVAAALCMLPAKTVQAQTAEQAAACVSCNASSGSVTASSSNSGCRRVRGRGPVRRALRGLGRVVTGRGPIARRVRSNRQSVRGNRAAQRSSNGGSAACVNCAELKASGPEGTVV